MNSTVQAERVVSDLRFGIGRPFAATISPDRPNKAGEKTLFTFSHDIATGYLVADQHDDLFGTLTSSTVFELSEKHGHYVESRAFTLTGGYSEGGGLNPILALDADGAIYGDSPAGGDLRACPQESGCGVVFELVPQKKTFVYSTLYRFQGGNDGEMPVGGLVRDTAGALYGVTNSGGTSVNCDYGCGTVFKLTPSPSGYVESLLYSFQGEADGLYPTQALTIDAAGNLYGLAQGGFGNYAGGVAFELSPNASGYTERTLYQFEAAPVLNGRFLIFSSQLMLGDDGRLYGTTANSGVSCPESPYDGCGTVYELRSRKNRYHLRLLHEFCGEPDGAYPGGLAFYHRRLYGTVNVGGTSDTGALYQIDIQGGNALSYIFDFGDSPPDSHPYPGLVVLRGGSRLIGEAVTYDSTYSDVFEVDQQHGLRERSSRTD